MRTYQQVLFMATKSTNMRSAATGWTFECGNVNANKVQSNFDIEVGQILSHIAGMAKPKTVAHALRLGWKLLSLQHEATETDDEAWWILTREVDADGALPA